MYSFNLIDFPKLFQTNIPLHLSLSPLQCLIFLDDPQAVSDILEKLVKEDNLLMAYQICFDLYESASQQFLSSVIQNLRTVGTPIPAVPGSTNTGTVPTPDKER